MSRVRNSRINILFLIFSLFIFSNSFACYKVVKISDGDTFDIEFNGDVNKYRVLGIDAFDKKRKYIEKQMNRTNLDLLNILIKYENGKKFAENHLLNKCVEVKGDFKAGRDPFNRKLVYIYIEGKDYSKMILEQGLAMVYCENKKIAKFEEYQQISQWKCK